MKKAFFFHLLFVTVVFALITAGCVRQSNSNRPVYVIFRYDDYSSLSATDIELKILDAFRQVNAPVTFAVIPRICANEVHNPSPQELIPLTSAKGEILKEGVKDGILDIALHGYSHQTNGITENSEFAGLDYNSQVERLASGGKDLETLVGEPVTAFVPPWNSYDLETLQALEELGFTTLSADKPGPALESSQLGFLPFTTDLAHLSNAIQTARASSDQQPLLVVLIHPYDFEEVSGAEGVLTFQAFTDQLKWLKAQPDIRFLSMSQAKQAIHDLSARRYLSNQRDYSLSGLLPEFLWDRKTTAIYQETEVFPRVIFRIAGFYLAVIAVGAALAWLLGKLIFPRSGLLKNLGSYGSTALTLSVVIYTFQDLNIHLRGLLISASAVGICLGLWISYFQLKRKTSNTGTKVVM